MNLVRAEKPRGDDKRARIIKAAGEQFVLSGLQGPMSEIAERAHVAIGSLYLYFKSKEELIKAVYADLAAEMTAFLVREPAPDEPHEERVKRYIRDYLDFIAMDPDRASLFGY
ncbi:MULTISPECIES: TetR/AcrR family transcriptional regulator [Rhodobacterales]|jgi:AcrR family transcriptional regulator|uniref:TetR family transcriptional regulator n=2 Tax=Rhodobacterales TaxID=204455 RepID=A0ABZ0V5A3_9RHOB|nr:MULTISPECIES: TetR family transcriptional regulator [Rhodobacterales]MBC7152963.1 TetR/AcrR family transcriptional regulator [Rhizobium sp.]MBY5974963.1 TetR family transcriptional regulator [Ferrimonas balearica]MDY6861302.1 TetR family transcriptional regulator [Pseudomonadota bacterium]HBR40605.1 TetR family transcriptional regulator [Sulfitobacter pontiacus]KZY50293.1 hypothetical protein A3734_21120 [Sulfitobacter sp. HI0054]|tara:strand:+ start:571 stop:909 length:339 start_codon:yes stop_codon:yes gene_type:complete